MPRLLLSHKTHLLKMNLKGFTLLEVMIAIAIISIALVSLQALNTRTIATHERLQRMTQATLLAQYKMSEVESSSKGTPFSGASQGVFAEPHDQYKWQINFTDTPLASVRMVTVDVTWGDKNKNESVSIDSFIF
ncbi:MAG: type II secretion system minor pseudopilin GspI [Deltaproteobacteria bacterium]|jgi:general secretion pathway protein I|nr:type II secretion system minor pseudopilin GspI [Deltaproteobacteria bacterium]